MIHCMIHCMIHNVIHGVIYGGERGLCASLPVGGHRDAVAADSLAVLACARSRSLTHGRVDAANRRRVESELR